MPLVKLLYRIPSAAQNPEDDVVNTWGFTLNNANTSGTINARNALLQFYESIFPYLTVHLDWDQPELKWYDMSQAPPRAPFEINYPLLPSQPTSVRSAAEIACCLSFQGEQISGIPQRRRRGRVYLGPMDAGSIQTTDGLFQVGVITGIAAAAQTFWQAHDAASDWSWMILSETPTLNGVYVDNGWIDNGIDIQRRRGTDATERRTFGNPAGLRSRADRRRASSGGEAATFGNT